MVRLPPRLRPLFPPLKSGYVAATRAAAPASMRISRLRGGYLPTGVAATLREAALDSGGRCESARPAETLVRPRPTGIPREHPAFAPVTAETVPPVSVAELPGGRVLGPHHAVISGSGKLVQEVSSYFGTSHPLQHPLFTNPFPKPPLHVAGRLGVLASRGDVNYFHFMFDVLPRLGVLEGCARIERPDRWYVSAGLAFQRDLLSRFGIGPEQLVDSSEHPHVRADCLVVPGVPSMDVLNPPWVVDFLRAHLPAPAVAPELRGPMYVTRGNSLNNRRVVNEEQVIDFLGARGFRFLDPAKLSVGEQIEAFAAASVIVAPHGAGETNIVFAAPGTRIVELFPDGTVQPDCYWRIAHALPGVSYRYLAGSAGPSRGGLAGSLVRDMVVDLPALAWLLDSDLADEAPAANPR